MSEFVGVRAELDSSSAMLNLAKTTTLGKQIFKRFPVVLVLAGVVAFNSGCTMPGTCDAAAYTTSRLLIQSLGERGLLEYVSGWTGPYTVKVPETWWMKLKEKERRDIIDALKCASAGPGKRPAGLEIMAMEDGKKLYGR